MKELGRVGFVGRFKPLHNSGALALETLCEQADLVKIGLGSCNKYNLRNPFTVEESQAMIEAILSPKFSNYELIHVPDFAHIPGYRNGQKWKEFMLKHYSELDYFATGNAYVRDLLASHYNIIHPASRIPREKWIRLRGTEVRVEMAQGEKWKELVPYPVVEYLERTGLIERFRREFGKETLAQLADYRRVETPQEECLHTQEQ